jgi:SWI/SNF-related matrix-associated actin-dependent regulator of chromatin subfamily A3
VRAITISRTKAVVRLPARIDEIHHLEFSPAEREKYEAAKIQSRLLLEDAISSGNQGGKTFNALRLLNILRLICNHGLLAQSTMESKVSQTSRSIGGLSPEETADFFYGNILGGSTTCLNCGVNLLDDLLEASVKSDLGTQRQGRSSDQMICERCIFQFEDSKTDYSPWNSVNSRENSNPATPSVDCDVAFTIENMSTKIKALVADLYKHSTTEKRFASTCICCNIYGND